MLARRTATATIAHVASAAGQVGVTPLGPHMALKTRTRDPPSRANHRPPPGFPDLSTMVVVAPKGRQFASRPAEPRQTFRSRTPLPVPCEDFHLVFDLENGDGPNGPAARPEWNLHLAIEVVIPTHRALSGIMGIDDGFHGNSLLTHLVVCPRHDSTVQTGLGQASCRAGTGASLRLSNRAGVNASLTLCNASSGLQPVMSTDTCALAKERLK